MARCRCRCRRSRRRPVGPLRARFPAPEHAQGAHDVRPSEAPVRFASRGRRSWPRRRPPISKGERDDRLSKRGKIPPAALGRAARAPAPLPHLLHQLLRLVEQCLPLVLLDRHRVVRFCPLEAGWAAVLEVSAVVAPRPPRAPAGKREKECVRACACVSRLSARDGFTVWSSNVCAIASRQAARPFLVPAVAAVAAAVALAPPPRPFRCCFTRSCNVASSSRTAT